MTRSQLRQLASLAANSNFTRYWFEFRRENGANMMAIAFLDWEGKAPNIYEADLLAKGFRRDDKALPVPVYVIEETV